MPNVMTKHTQSPDNNVVRISARPTQGRKSSEFPIMAPHDVLATAGSAADPRMQEALRLAKAFLAIEDAEARAAILTLAERLVSHGWLMTAHKR
jgi:hypothetical protein